MRTSIICIGALTLALTACSSHQSMPAPTSGGLHGVGPNVVQTGKTPVQWSQFKWGSTSSSSQYDSIVTGSDKNVWLTDINGQNLVQMKMTGATKVFPLTFNGTSRFSPANMTVGADGKFYISTTNSPGFIGVAKNTGTFTVTAIPSGDYGYDGGLTLGPDGNVWFTELKHIGKITPTGKVTEIAYPDGQTNNLFGSITTGSDGDIWVSEYNQPYIDDVDPLTNGVTVYSLPCALSGLVSAADGNLYGPCGGSIVRITTSGSWSLIANPFSTDGFPTSFITGLDGNPWFTAANSNQVIQYNAGNGTLHAFYPPSTFGNDYGLAAGPDGNYWAVGNNAMIDIYIVDTLVVTPAPIKLTSIGQTQVITIKEPNTSTWTVTSSSPGVATVTPVSGHANEYTVKAIGVGSTNVSVKDAIGNSFVDKVTVT